MKKNLILKWIFVFLIIVDIFAFALVFFVGMMDAIYFLDVIEIVSGWIMFQLGSIVTLILTKLFDKIKK